MFGSLRSRLLASYALIAGLLLALVTLSLLFFLLRNPIAQRQVYQRLELVATVVAERDDLLLRGASPERIQAALARLGLPEARALLLGPTGEVLADSRPGAPGPPENVLAELAATAQGSRTDYEDADGRRWLALTEPAQRGRVLVLAAPAPPRGGLLVLGEELVMPLVQAGLVALAVSVLLAWVIARWIAAPLHRMVQAARAVASGDYRSQLPLSGPAEVRMLAAAFNEMVQRVESSRKAQRDFVANVSHDLKTPLTSIQGFAQAILDGAAGDETSRRQAARVIFDESERLHRLVDGLLDLARLDAGQVVFRKDPVDVAALLRAVAERSALRAADSKVRIDNQVGSTVPVTGDGDRLAQVFSNLVDNALKHTPAGGVVLLTSDPAPGWLRIHVADTGPGIPPEELTRIFERFYQVDRARPRDRGQGVGLGLAIAREIMLAHGGKLTAQSVLGQGSRFTVHLPLPGSVTTAISRRRR